MKTYCFNLYNSKRNKKLHRQINAAGLIYNHCIAIHKRYYRLFKKSLHKFALQEHLTKLKKLAKFSYLNEIGSQAVQNITERIDRAYKLFFRNQKHNIRSSPPSLKKVRKYKSYTLKTSGWKLLSGNVIRIASQKYHYFKSRDISGKVKTITIKRDALGDIYLYFSCETNENEVLTRTGNSVGFDFGLKRFLTGSERENIISPLFFKQNVNLIAKANRNLSRKQKSSNNRKKARLNLARLHKRVANMRRDFHWKTAQCLAGKYALISIENLNLKAMQKRFGRKISDLGFADFVNKLKYEAQKAGSIVVEVGKFFPSSQLCSNCGYQNKELKDLRIREWTCPKCGKHHDRDLNAAINIKKEGERIFFSLK
ncbi:RNA-guided endonuclease InsQ/TnpB family protein [Megamonas hypermegale]|uniref:RNA-guided endonuclease InsQ/TnpB family protein n=1 Tax=Megamonas hypermegale TaxID=158847 RepID=UPI0026F2A8DE|nr:RNA-guided endonuclease TnpB family protein [Megamonas hypermegale]